jgi:hypothetical protein
VAVLIPILKTVLPYFVPIIRAAIPVFTSKPSTAKSDPFVSQQITELQDVVKTNAESLKIIAEQMQRTVQGIEEAAAANEGALRHVRIIATAALVVALISLIAVLVVAWLR